MKEKYDGLRSAARKIYKLSMFPGFLLGFFSLLSFSDLGRQPGETGLLWVVILVTLLLVAGMLLHRKKHGDLGNPFGWYLWGSILGAVVLVITGEWSIWMGGAIVLLCLGMTAGLLGLF